MQDKKSKNIIPFNLNINKEDTKDYLSNKRIKLFDKNKCIKKTENILNHKSNNIKGKFKILKKNQKIISYNDNELNNLTYDLALKIDKRNYCNYYIYFFL